MPIIRLYQILLLILIVISLPTLAGEVKKQLIFGQVGLNDSPRPALTILRQAYQQLGISLSTKGYPSKRSLVMSNRGELDGELVRIEGISTLYPNLIAVPVILFKGSVSMFTIDGRTSFDHNDHLFLSWTAIRGGIIWQENFATSHLKRVFRVDSISQQMTLLINGRVKYILASLPLINKLKKTDPRYAKLKQVQLPLIKNNFVHYLHKKHRHLIPQLTIELEKIIAATNVQPSTVPSACCETH